MSERASPLPREAFAVFRPITTRWMDNDAYGHVNNVVYYSYFDTAVNAWLVENGHLVIGDSPVISVKRRLKVRSARPERRTISSTGAATEKCAASHAWASFV